MEEGKQGAGKEDRDRGGQGRYRKEDGKGGGGKEDGRRGTGVGGEKRVEKVKKEQGIDRYRVRGTKMIMTLTQSWHIRTLLGK